MEYQKSLKRIRKQVPKGQLKGSTNFKKVSNWKRYQKLKELKLLKMYQKITTIITVSKT